MTDASSPSIADAARAIDAADALLVAVGGAHDLPGGLSDLATSSDAFRDACPVWADLGLSFQDLSDVRWFARDPTLAWALYGPLVQRAGVAHPGALWSALARWVEAHRHAFVFTSVTSGLAERAGVGADHVYEVHGSLHWMQCSLPCTDTLWPASEVQPGALTVDASSGRLVDGQDWPRCPACGRTARPNVIGANDWTFVDARVTAQHQRYRHWLANVHAGRLVVVELGTSTRSDDAVRAQAESLVEAGATLVRLGHRGPSAEGRITVATDAAEAVAAVDAMLTRSGSARSES